MQVVLVDAAEEPHPSRLPFPLEIQGAEKTRGQESGVWRPPCCRRAEEGVQKTRGETREEKGKGERR